MLVEGAADKENIDGDTEGLQINYEDASTSTKFHNPSDFSRWINGTDINQMDARELDEFEATLLEAFRQIKHRKIFFSIVEHMPLHGEIDWGLASLR
ncbi:uncharacterized protein LOC144565614 isoform X3 [Carex rostrata]